MTRVAGHTLRNEGAAFEMWTAFPQGEARPIRVRWNGTSGIGFALCSCGARSPILNSANLRKAWHRNHKTEVAS